MLSRKSRNLPLRAVPRAKTRVRRAAAVAAPSIIQAVAKTSQNTLQHLRRHPAVTRAVAAGVVNNATFSPFLFICYDSLLFQQKVNELEGFR